jgi:hypothetical protein
MNAKSSTNTMPFEHEHKRERAGEHVQFNARTCSKLAKQGDALSDPAHRDVDPVPAEIGTWWRACPTKAFSLRLVSQGSAQRNHKSIPHDQRAIDCGTPNRQIALD